MGAMQHKRQCKCMAGCTAMGTTDHGQERAAGAQLWSLCARGAMNGPCRVDVRGEAHIHEHDVDEHRCISEGTSCRPMGRRVDVAGHNACTKLEIERYEGTSLSPLGCLLQRKRHRSRRTIQWTEVLHALG
jgi:hypothetical protein